MNKASNSSQEIELRKVRESDLPIFFEQQNDPAAHEMVGVTSHAPDDREAYFEKWERILPDKNITKRTILYNGDVAGVINCFFAPWSEEWEVGYWIGREFWGLGIASGALRLFLEIEERRPLHATASTHNKASVAVLEKCGFEKTGKKKVLVERSGKEIEEFSFVLN
ncbi:MAG: GNAT family N-acetyltransferase [Acidobacteriota bacterium]|nr:GNAT family N-acetyltransferase [Acidobacteriota bacterium]MDH3530214.1 GNAT family N-acetyltransferase [Acidobacteriota bacterium]